MCVGKNACTRMHRCVRRCICIYTVCLCDSVCETDVHRLLACRHCSTLTQPATSPYAYSSAVVIYLRIAIPTYNKQHILLLLLLIAKLRIIIALYS